MIMAREHSGSPPRKAASALAAVVALLTSAAGASAAGPSAGPIGYTLVGPSLQRIDLTTLELEPVGDTGGVFAFDLAFHADGTLYGHSGVGGGSMQLASFDPVTGAGRVVAEIDLGFDFALGGIAGDAGGGLWAMILPSTGSPPMILAVDPVGGTAGPPVEIAGPVSITSLAACGDLLVATGASGLVAIDPISGETTALLPNAPPANLDMAHGPDGGIWATHIVPIMGAPTAILRLDLSTGEITSPGHVFGVGALAIAPPAGGPCLGAPPAIPALSPLALLALAGALGAVGLGLARRRG